MIIANGSARRVMDAILLTKAPIDGLGSCDRKRLGPFTACLSLNLLDPKRMM
jgi:hypothetical protein